VEKHNRKRALIFLGEQDEKKMAGLKKTVGDDGGKKTAGAILRSGLAALHRLGNEEIISIAAEIFRERHANEKIVQRSLFLRKKEYEFMKEIKGRVPFINTQRTAFLCGLEALRRLPDEEIVRMVSGDLSLNGRLKENRAVNGG